MLVAFVEGAREVALACSLGVIVPGLVALALSRRRWLLASATFVPTVAIVFWMRATKLFDLSDSSVTLALVLLGGLLLTAFAMRAERYVAGLIGMGLFAGSTWQPCVGAELGALLNKAPTSPLATFGPLVAYTLGLTLALIAIAVLPRMSTRVEKVMDSNIVRTIGIGVAIALLAAVLLGRYNSLLGELARISLA